MGREEFVAPSSLAAAPRVSLMVVVGQDWITGGNSDSNTLVVVFSEVERASK
jgi:hypothetical protein